MKHAFSLSLSFFEEIWNLEAFAIFQKVKWNSYF